MKDTFRKGAVLFLAGLLIMPLGGCKQKEELAPSTPEATASAEPETAVLKIENYPVIHETEFGGVYIKMTIDEFNEVGFKYGDSVDVEFSNGYKLEDIPYYNGYYVDAGSPLLIAYPGYDYIKAAINYGDDLWERAGLQSDLLQAPKTLWLAAGLEEKSTATVTLREAGRYADVQEARDIHYSDDRTKFDSDVIFANFRNMKMGDIKENILYRSASPCDNQHSRAPYVDDLIEEAGVRCIMNLSDNETKLEKYISADDFDSPYFLSLYEEGKVLPLALNMNYLSDEFAAKIARGLTAMGETEGPYLVHCTEGKDRTGFVCMLIEALAGASYEEIVDDYMVTYDNYYKITEDSDPAKYTTIKEKNLDAMLKCVVNDTSVDIETADLSVYARNYLLHAGMTDAQIDAFLAKISE